MCHEHHYSCPVYPDKPRFYQHDGTWWADIRNHPAGKKGVRKMLKIRYCPTDDMLADFPSKPLQGSLFRKHFRRMMNVQDNNKKPERKGRGY